MLMLALLAVPAAAQDPLRLSIMPRFYPEKIAAMIRPLPACLANRTGLSFVDVPTRNNSDSEAHIRDGRIDVGFENPILYARISDLRRCCAHGVGGRGLRIVPWYLSDSNGRPPPALAGLEGPAHHDGGVNLGGYLSQKKRSA
jgi:phosphonate transport system substrate-binding protein